MKIELVVALLALAAASGAHADDGDNTCRNGDFPSSQAPFGLAQVTGAARLYFLEDSDGCPNAEARCRQRAYVVTGNTLITGRSQGDYVCAFFPNRVGGSAGWVPGARLAATPVPAAGLPAWVGMWKNGDNSIRLRAKGAALEASGEAFWPSANPPLADRPGGPNLGDMSGVARPKGNQVVFADASDPSACSVSLTLLGDVLLASDNNACGGMNVSFTGVYRRK